MVKSNNSKYGKKSKGLRAINLPDCTLVPNELIENYLPLLSEIELKTLLIMLQAHTFPQISFRGLTLKDIQKRLTSKSERFVDDNKYSESKIKQAIDYLIQVGLLTSKEIEDTNIYRYYINLQKEVPEEISQEENQIRKQPPITELDADEEDFIGMDIETKLTKELNEEEEKLNNKIKTEDVEKSTKAEVTKEKSESESEKEVKKEKEAPLTEAVPLGDIQARLKSDLEKDVSHEKPKEEPPPIEKAAPKKEEKTMAEVAAEKAEEKDKTEEKKGKDTWKTILEKSADILDTFTFQQWLTPTQYKGYKNGVHLISVPSKKFYSWFDKEFKDVLDDAINEIDPDFKYKFISAEEED